MISVVSMCRQTLFALVLVLWICEPARTHYLSRSNHRSGVIPLRQPRRPVAPKISKPDFLSAFEANTHYRTMLTKTKCREPRPVVVNVKQEHNDFAVNYLPHCTILHRCDAEAGCCGDDRICTWESIEYVHLYFYAIPVDTNRTGNEIVKLIFANHTSCVCKEDSDFNEVDGEKSTDTQSDHGSDDEDGKKYKPCPPPFEKRFLGQDQETCDCFEGETECIDIKKGIRELSLAESNGVRRGDYEPPRCYTESFDTTTRRCPPVCREGLVYNQRKKLCVEKHRKRLRNRQRHARHRTM